MANVIDSSINDLPIPGKDYYGWQKFIYVPRDDMQYDPSINAYIRFGDDTFGVKIASKNLATCGRLQFGLASTGHGKYAIAMRRVNYATLSPMTEWITITKYENRKDKVKKMFALMWQGIIMMNSSTFQAI